MLHASLCHISKKDMYLASTLSSWIILDLLDFLVLHLMSLAYHGSAIDLLELSGPYIGPWILLGYSLNHTFV